MSADPYYGNQPEQVEYHGAPLGIIYSFGTVWHDRHGTREKVSIKSYPNGMRIGCTFVSNSALEQIWKYHQEYLNRTDIVEHQSGV